MKIESANDPNSFDNEKGGKYSSKRNPSEIPGEAANEMGIPKPGSSDFDPNSTQTNALLNIRDNQFNLILQ